MRVGGTSVPAAVLAPGASPTFEFSCLPDTPEDLLKWFRPSWPSGNDIQFEIPPAGAKSLKTAGNRGDFAQQSSD